MKAIRVHEFGAPQVMRLEEVSEPTAGPGQVIVRLSAIGVNLRMRRSFPSMTMGPDGTMSMGGRGMGGPGRGMGGPGMGGPGGAWGDPNAAWDVLRERMHQSVPGLPEQVGKYPHLGQQKLGDDWHMNIVDGPVAVPFDTIGVGQRDGGDKNDCGLLKARMIADHPSEFKTVELRHADIAQNDSDVLFEKMLERLSGGPGFDQVFSEALQGGKSDEAFRRSPGLGGGSVDTGHGIWATAGRQDD
jgi:hypothetical protein